VSRLRLRVSHKDAALVQSQGTTTRSYRPFAQAFGPTKRAAEANAALIVKAVNCHNHLVFAMQRVQHAARLPAGANGQRLQARLKMIARHAATALERLDK
jgi:hypothetical protein